MAGGRQRLWMVLAIGLAVAGFAVEVLRPPLAGGFFYMGAVYFWYLARPSWRSLVLLMLFVTCLLVLDRVHMALQGELTGTLVAERATVLAALWVVTALLVGRTRQSGRVSDAEDTVQRYLDLAGVIIVALDREGRIETLNRAGCELLGVDEKEVIGESWVVRFIPPEERPFVRAIHASSTGGQAVSDPVENAIQAVDGTRRRVLWRNTVTRAPDGTIVGSLSSGMDVTEIREAERALARAREEMRDKDALARIGEMASVVAHEVRNPLAGLKSTLQILRGRASGDSEDREIIGAMIERIDALNQMVEELLSFVRPASLERAPVAIDTVARRVAELADDPHEPIVELDLGSRGGVVRGDPAQLEQALLNLLLNALHASSGEPKSVALRTCIDGAMCETRIEDDGPGVPEAIRGRIFEPFVTTRSGGTGLGLAVAKRIVQAHGGTLTVDDRPGGGTVATMRLPREVPARSSEPLRAGSPST